MIEPISALPLSDKEKRLLDKTPDADRQSRKQALLAQLSELPDLLLLDSLHPKALTGANCLLELAGVELDLDQKDDAWQHARSTVEVFIEQEAFENAALACQYIYLADKDDAIAAIGQAAWLSVTYPIDPHLTANILSHIIDETPDASDGAAVAAATAHFVADLRATDSAREDLRLLTGANLARVAKRHANVKSH